MTQPWATLVALGENRIETRSWSTSHRGPLAIHAAKSFPPDARALCDERPFREVLDAHGIESWRQLPTGAIIARVRVDDVIAFDAGSEARVRAESKRGLWPRHEADFGDFSPGRFGFVLSDVRRLREPIPARGMLGLWEVPGTIEQQLREALQ